MAMTTSLIFLTLPIAAALVAADPAVQTQTATAASALYDGLKSIAMELTVLLIFFLTWSATRYMVKAKGSEPAPEKEKEKAKAKPKRSPSENAEMITMLCQDQFTRGLRLYRDLVKHDQDKEIVDEDFYTSLVEAAVRVSKPDVAEQVVARMHANHMVPSHAFVQSVLKLFAARKLYAECLRVWDMFGPVLEPHQVIYSCAAVAACETGDTALARRLLAEAQKHFEIPSREWLALMRYHVRMRSWETAVQDLRDLMAQGMPIDNIVFNTCLSACSLGEPQGAAIPTMHLLIDELTAYEKEHPCQDLTKTVDIVSYNTLMKALARNGDVEACFKLLETFVSRDIEPDDVSFSTLLDVCIDEDEHQLASVALERMASAGLQMNCIVMTTLMKGFIRSKRLDKAMQLYESMQASSSQVKPDMITHSMLIKAHCDAHDMGTALRILEDMLESECTVDDVVFTHLIEGCCQVNNLRLAEKLFSDMRAASIKPSIYTLNGMVKVYGKCGNSEKAVELVDSMEQEHGLKPTVVVFTCLVSGLIRQKKHQAAWDVFQRMGDSVRPDAQSTQTMLVGLSDGQMWSEFLQLAEKALTAFKLDDGPDRRRNATRPTGLAECLNYGLAAMLNRSRVTPARALYTLMVKWQVEATVPAVRRRLNLVD